MFRFAAILFLILSSCALNAQAEPRIYVLHDSVGERIDLQEKIDHRLFPFWSDTAFDHAEFFMQQDSSIVLVGTMKNGTVQEIKCSKDDIFHYNFLVRYHEGLIPESSSSETFGKFFGGALIGLGSAIITYIQTQRERR